VTLARVAAGAFALFYGAAEAIAGIATGTLVRYVFDLPPDAQAAAAVTRTVTVPGRSTRTLSL
jgi:hypothetical protein